MSLRWLPLGALALAIVLALFLGMQLWIATPEPALAPSNRIDAVEVVQVEPEPEAPEEQLMEESAPPPPPLAPPSLERPDMPSINVPSVPAAPVDAGAITVPATLGASTLGLGASGSFGGFSGRGAGGAGMGTGEGFRGKPLIPLSTARPQMPDWACAQKIRGWVEVVFTVLPSGRVTDIKLVDASPRGVFEAAAVESISNWIYASSKSAREVKQRVPMDPEDCAYNWK